MTTTKDDTIKALINMKFGGEFLDEILKWIANAFDPEDVFDEDDLKDWAEGYGYTLEDEY